MFSRGSCWLKQTFFEQILLKIPNCKVFLNSCLGFIGSFVTASIVSVRYIPWRRKWSAVKKYELREVFFTLLVVYRMSNNLRSSYFSLNFDDYFRKSKFAMFLFLFFNARSLLRSVSRRFRFSKKTKFEFSFKCRIV